MAKTLNKIIECGEFNRVECPNYATDFCTYKCVYAIEQQKEDIIFETHGDGYIK